MFKWIARLRRILRMLYQFGYVILLFDLAVALFSQPLVDIKSFAVVFIILVASYLLRDNLSHGWVMLLTHVALGAAGYFLVSPLHVRIFVALATAEFFFDGFVYMSHGYILKRYFDAPWGSFALGIAAVALGTYMHVPTLLILGYVIPIVMVFIYLIGLYIEGLEKYLASSGRVSGAPIGQIVSVNSLIVSGIMIICLAVLGLAELLNLQVVLIQFVRALLMIGKIVIIIVFGLLNLFMGLIGGGDIDFKGTFSRVQSVAEETSLLASILNFILVVAVIGAVVYIIIKMIKWIIKVLIKKQDRNHDITEDLTPKKNVLIREKVVHEDRLGRQSPVMQARRIYRRKVLSFQKYFVPDKTDTTGDIERAILQTVGLGKSESEDTITAMYNAVRYGKLEPDKDYLDRMKKK